MAPSCAFTKPSCRKPIPHALTKLLLEAFNRFTSCSNLTLETSDQSRRDLKTESCIQTRKVIAAINWRRAPNQLSLNITAWDRFDYRWGRFIISLKPNKPARLTQKVISVKLYWEKSTSVALTVFKTTEGTKLWWLNRNVVFYGCCKTAQVIIIFSPGDEQLTFDVGVLVNECWTC